MRKNIKKGKMNKNGVKNIQVLDDRQKAVVYPGFGCTTDVLDYIISTGNDEITLREVDMDYVRRNSISKKYEGLPRDILAKHLYNLGWRQWSFDNCIWLAPTHNCFKEHKKH